MKYSGADFKMTSQANHLAKLLTLKAENNRENIHAQRLYKRRKFHEDGHVMSNWHILNQSAITSSNSVLPQIDEGSRPIVIEEGQEAEWEPIT
jgi:TRAP-type C4-dicarboxylate transport system substrate-binding protein